MFKKIVLPALILTTVVPQVVLAAWWNPFRWFDNWSFIKSDREKEALEVRIKTLEARLAEKYFDQATSSSEEVVEKKEELSSITVSKSVLDPHPASKPVIQTQVQIPTVSVNTTPTLSIPTIPSLIKTYTDFRGYIETEQRVLNKKSSLYTERNYYMYLEDLLIKINASIGYLYNIKDWNIRPENIEQIYLSKLNEMKRKHQSVADTYVVDRKQNEQSLARQEVINYIETNKHHLYEVDTHIEAARLLYVFDIFFNTSYAKEFELKKTQQETIEFANRFLMDQR